MLELSAMSNWYWTIVWKKKYKQKISPCQLIPIKSRRSISLITCWRHWKFKDYARNSFCFIKRLSDYSIIMFVGSLCKSIKNAVKIWFQFTNIKFSSHTKNMISLFKSSNFLTKHLCRHSRVTNTLKCLLV